MGHHYTKTEEMLRRISDNTGVSCDNCKKVYSALIDEFIDCFKAEEKLKIPRLGTLSLDQYGYHYYPANHLLRKKGVKGYDD